MNSQSDKNNVISLPESSSEAVDINKPDITNIFSTGLLNILSKAVSKQIINQEMQFLAKTVIQKLSEKININVNKAEKELSQKTYSINSTDKTDTGGSEKRSDTTEDRLSAKAANKKSTIDTLFMPVSLFS